MAAAAGLAVTLVPVLMGYLIRGRIPDERRNPLNRVLIAVYRPLLDGVLRLAEDDALPSRCCCWPATAWPILQLGGEFMPPLDEGDLLYMPTALPGLSAGKAAELLQQTDRLIKTRARGAAVFGKAGRAETATDPAPLEMFETTIQFKPQERVARRHDPRQAGRGTGPHRQGARAGQHLGAADPQPHRHAGHRHQEPGRHQGGGHRPGRDRPHRRRDREGGEGRAGRQLRAGRAADRRALRRREHRPRRRGALRHEHR